MSDVVGAWTRWVGILLCFCFRISPFTYAIHTGVSSHSNTRAVGWCDLQHAQASIQLPPCQWPIQPRGRAPLSLCPAWAPSFHLESSTQRCHRTRQKYVFVEIRGKYYNSEAKLTWTMCELAMFLNLTISVWLWKIPVSIQVASFSLVRQRCDSSRQTR